MRAPSRWRRVDPHRAAWLAKYAREPSPWRGPVHAAPLLADLRGRVLELGAGGGKVGAALPPDALALDWAALPPGRPGALADVRALPMRDTSVDAIVAIHLLQHLLTPDRARAADEIRRVLKPNGVLVVEVPARGDARETTGRQVEPSTREREGILTHTFDETELRALLHGLHGTLATEARTMRWGTRRVLRGRLTRGE